VCACAQAATITAANPRRPIGGEHTQRRYFASS
jgi:hypothetical protein